MNNNTPQSIKIFRSLKKIALKKNTKEPAFIGWTKPQQHFEFINNINYNVGIPTGNVNGIIGLDIDKKDDGLIEFKLYTDKYGEPQTVKQTTPNGGFHLIYKNTHSNPTYNFLMQTYLTNKTKFRGAGIDIRNEGGFIASEPSTIDGKPYKYIRSFDKYPILEMPETLIDWLLVGQKEKVDKKDKATPLLKNKKDDIKLSITDDKLNELLNKLPTTYLDDYNNWIYILTIFKNIDKWDILDKWSVQSKNYNYIKNVKLWNYNKGVIDINFLIHLVNIENNLNVPLVSIFKPYTPITKVNDEIKQITMNNKYMYDVNYKENQFTPDIFNEYETIIIQSTTGTGKTTATAEHCKNSINKIISIIPRISLANQHKDTFKKKNILLLSYLVNDNLEKELNVRTDNIVICINSLLKLQNLSLDIIQNSIIYIDEISSFIESLVDNETLNNNLKKINSLLMKLVKNAYKVIVSDALINDATFELLKHRPNNKKIFIQNDYVKFSNVPAIRIKDEELFLNMVKAKIIKGEPFLFPCDSCKTITKLYLECLKMSPDEFKVKFMLVTAETKVKINDASDELQDKFVFYSPSITYGVDFQTKEPQDVYNYIKGGSIQPSGFFQQTTRTRNIKTLYYYCVEHSFAPKYNNLDDVKNYYRNIDNITNNSLNNICVTINTDDEAIVNENTFFNLFCYNEYVKDIYKTNKLKHFEELLIKNGFVLSELGEDKKMTEDQKAELDANIIEYNENLFNEYLNLPIEERTDALKFCNFNEHVETFKLCNKTNEELIKIKQCMTNKYYFGEILNYNRLLKNETYINKKLNQINDESFRIKSFNSPYRRIKILFDICNNNNMNLLDFKCDTENIIFSNDTYKLYKIVFNSPNAKKPTNKKELIKLLVNSYKLLMPTLKIINTKTTQLNNKGNKIRIYEYSLDNDIINECNEILKIYGFIKKDETNDSIIENCNIEEFIDDADEEENINNNVTTHHQFNFHSQLFKYTMCNNITVCSHCNISQTDIYVHCVECKHFFT